MVSDHYVLKPQPEAISKILDITENMAGCYGFDGKEIMRIRLLCEEMVSAVHSGLALVPAELWFSTKDRMFIITALVRTDYCGMPRERREKLLKEFKQPKKAGLFGIIKAFMDEIVLADEEINLNSYLGMYYHDYSEFSFRSPLDMSMIEDLCRRSAPPTPLRIESEPEDKGMDDVQANLEISLLKGFADDIRVTNTFGTLEMSVMKKIPENFLYGYIVDETSKSL